MTKSHTVIFKVKLVFDFVSRFMKRPNSGKKSKRNKILLAWPKTCRRRQLAEGWLVLVVVMVMVVRDICLAHKAVKAITLEVCVRDAN